MEQVVATSAAGGASEAYNQNSDDDVDEGEDLGDEWLLEEKVSGGSNAWTRDANRALINIRGPMEGRFTEGRQKHITLWLQCTRQLQKMGYRYSTAKVQRKWQNMLVTYYKNLSRKNMSAYVSWEFFEVMFKYLEGKKADSEIQLQHQQQQQQQEQQSQQIKQPQQLLAAMQQPPQLTAAIQQTPMQRQQAANALQPQVQIDTKSNDEFDEDSTTMSEIMEPKLDLPHPNDFERNVNSNGGHGNFLRNNDKDQSEWWKDYIERKLEVDRNMHRELMQFNKMSLVQQEKIERVKIDAINNLTCTLQKLVEICELF